MNPQGGRAIRFVSAVVLLNVAALTVLGLMVQRALDSTARNAHRIEANSYRMCRTQESNVARLNRLYAGLADIERHNPFGKTSPATIQHRIDLYTAAQLGTVDCGRRP